METKVDHIGIAVENIEERVQFYENILNVKVEHTEVVESEKVKTAFLNIGGTHVELLESTEPDGPIGQYVAKRGEGIHHICYAVPDVKKALEECQKMGLRLIHEEPKQGAKGKLIAFIHPKSTGGVLVELSQDAPEA